MTRKRIQFVVSLLITAFFLYLACRNVQWADLWEGLRGTNYIWAIPFMAVTLFSMWFRAVRWAYLLEPVVKTSSRKLFEPIMVCFALNSILPGRVGEFARAYLVGKDYRVPFTSAFATVIVERIADGLGLLVFFVALLALLDLPEGVELTWDGTRQIEGTSLILWASISLVVVAAVALALAVPARRAAVRGASGAGALGRIEAFFARRRRPRAAATALFAVAVFSLAVVAVVAAGKVFDPQRTYTFGRKWEINAAQLDTLARKLLIICVVLLIGSVLMLFAWFRRLVQAIVRRTPLLPVGLKDAVNRLIETLSQGFESLRSPRSVFWIVFHTATVWLTVGWSLQIMAYGFASMNLAFIQAMAVSIIICVAILIPAAPGYWGLYEVGCIVALQMLGVVETTPKGHADALGYSLVAHFIQMLPILVLGLWYLWRRRVGLAELTSGENPETA